MQVATTSSSGEGPGNCIALLFVNNTSEQVDISWYAEGYAECPYRKLSPGRRERVGSYDCHKWKVRSLQGKQLAAEAAVFECGAVFAAVLQWPACRWLNVRWLVDCATLFQLWVHGSCNTALPFESYAGKLRRDLQTLEGLTFG